MTRDPELDRRIADVLAKLSTLSEVPAASVDITQAKAAERDLPAGVSERQRDPDRPPSKERSLYDYYAWVFARAHTDHERRTWLYLAETDLNVRQHRAPFEREEYTTHKDRGRVIGQGLADQEGARNRRNRRILDWYEGLPALMAALAESAHGGHVSEANVRQVRIRDRRDPETGIKYAGWKGMSDEDRTKAIENLRRQGMGRPSIAQELGVAQGTVQRYEAGYKRTSLRPR